MACGALKFAQLRTVRSYVRSSSPSIARVASSEEMDELFRSKTVKKFWIASLVAVALSAVGFVVHLRTRVGPVHLREPIQVYHFTEQSRVDYEPYSWSEAKLTGYRSNSPVFEAGKIRSYRIGRNTRGIGWRRDPRFANRLEIWFDYEDLARFKAVCEEYQDETLVVRMGGEDVASMYIYFQMQNPLVLRSNNTQEWMQQLLLREGE